MTHTYVELEVSDQVYDEIAQKLKAAGYDHAFMEGGAIDMHGIGLVKAEPKFEMRIETCPKCGAKGVAFICDTRGCPVNGGAAHD